MLWYSSQRHDALPRRFVCLCVCVKVIKNVDKTFHPFFAPPLSIWLCSLSHHLSFDGGGVGGDDADTVAAAITICNYNDTTVSYILMTRKACWNENLTYKSTRAVFKLISWSRYGSAGATASKNVQQSGRKLWDRRHSQRKQGDRERS